MILTLLSWAIDDSVIQCEKEPRVEKFAEDTLDEVDSF